MKSIFTTIFATALTLSLSTNMAQAENNSADAHLVNMLGNYTELSQRGHWVNQWMPDATGNTVYKVVSADQRLAEIVASYTRESLDRGGWVNSLLDNSQYASGNPLLAVHIGEGVTEFSAYHRIPQG